LIGAFKTAVNVVKSGANAIVNVSYAITTALTPKPAPVITKTTREQAAAAHNDVTKRLAPGKISIDQSSPGYINISFSGGTVLMVGPVPLPVGAGVGVKITKDGLSPYIGFGASSPGLGGSIKVSPSYVDHGWNRPEASLECAGAASWDTKGNPTESGVAWPCGASIMGGYTFDEMSWVDYY
jgi:hypothetical protein